MASTNIFLALSFSPKNSSGRVLANSTRFFPKMAPFPQQNMPSYFHPSTYSIFEGYQQKFDHYYCLTISKIVGDGSVSATNMTKADYRNFL
jgi:hypothetical protein